MHTNRECVVFTTKSRDVPGAVDLNCDRVIVFETDEHVMCEESGNGNLEVTCLTTVARILVDIVKSEKSIEKLYK